MKLLFDDQYEGPRYRYGLRYRPVAIGAVPKGWIIGSLRPHPDYRHGTVDYPERLADRVATSYELALVEEIDTGQSGESA